MADHTFQEQLTKYLTDAHAIDVQALEQMKRAPGLAGDPDLAQIFTAHEAETREHERLVREALEQRDAAPSTVKDVVAHIGAQERAMAKRIGERWDAAVEASLREKDAEDVREEVVKYLRDAHALEAQSLQMLEAGPKIAECDALFEALEAGTYELLARTARRAGDQQTVALAERILGDENAAAEQVAGTWDAAVDATLQKQLV